MLSCPFSISSAFNFIRNLSISPTTFALFSCALHSHFLCIICPSDIFSFHNLLVIHLLPFLPFPGVPQYTPHYIPSNLVRGKMWCNFLCKSKLWEVEYWTQHVTWQKVMFTKSISIKWKFQFRGDWNGGAQYSKTSEGRICKMKVNQKQMIILD